MAKVVLCYQHRETEPSFTLVLKDNHLITLTCRRVVAATGIAPNSPRPPRRYRFLMTLHMLASYTHVQNRTPHALQFVLVNGANNPFPNCDFTWINQEEHAAAAAP